jgi:hypothetical protein
MIVPENGKARADQHAVATNRRTVDREAFLILPFPTLLRVLEHLS